jgi:hypothetical protein
MRIIASLLVLASGVLLAACASGGSHPASSQPGAHTGSPDTGIVAIVACFHAHGDPGFPDPVYDPGDGRWHFAASPATAPQSTRQACQHLLPATAASPPVPQAQFQQLVQLAQCFRQHGEPTWPDPNPDGAFPLPPSLMKKTPASVHALRACQRYVPIGGMNVYAAS